MWYVSGTEREAKITPEITQQPKNRSMASPSSLNDTLAVSFYLYDHLGNTRIVYQPAIQCPSFTTYTIETAMDYYPYGKVLRQFHIGEQEKFLTTQHERDIETGLDYRGARFYDSDIARFLSLDPHASDYQSWSDYNYVLGNPLMFIDPDGKDAQSPNPLMYMAHEMKKFFAAVGDFFTFKWWGKGKISKKNSEYTNGTITVENLSYTRADGSITTNFGEAILNESVYLDEYFEASFSLYVGTETVVTYGLENAPASATTTTAVETDENGNTVLKNSTKGKGSYGGVTGVVKSSVSSDGEVESSHEASVGIGDNKVYIKSTQSSNSGNSVEAVGQVGGKILIFGTGIILEGNTGASVRIKL